MRYETNQANRLGNREINQDRLAVVDHRDGVLLVLADGMGGHQDGELAAQTVVETLTRRFERARRPLQDPAAFLAAGIHEAHSEILRYGSRRDPNTQPRTTCVACLVQGDSAWWAHVGDSRLYLLRGGQVHQRTQDHSYVEGLYRSGKITEKQKAAHPLRNYVTQCLGGQSIGPRIDHGMQAQLQPRDVILLCSDGLWSPLAEEELALSLCSSSLGDALNGLATKAEQASYPMADNISAVTLRWLSPHQPTNKRRPGKTSRTTRSTARRTVNDDQVTKAIDEIKHVLEEYEKELDR